MKSYLAMVVAVLLLASGRCLAVDPAPSAPETPAPPANAPAVVPAVVPVDAAPVPPPPPFLHRELGNTYASLGEGTQEYYSPPGIFTFSAEYLLWSIKGDRLPPLVTVGPSGSGALLGQPGVSTVFGGATVDHNPYSGVRASADIWLDTCYTLGIEAGYMLLANQAVRSTTGSSGEPGTPDLARPFFNVVTGQQGSLVIGSANVSSGYITAQSDTSMFGIEALGVWDVCRNCNFTLDLLGGIGYLELDDSVNVTAATILNILPVISTTSTDQFTVRNHIFGGELGARAEFRFGKLEITLVDKVTLGDDSANVEISGGTFQASPLGTGVMLGAGVLAQPSNLGKHTVNTFCAVDQTTVQAGWNFGEFLQGFLGYSLLYASSVVRGGDTIDTGVNPNQAFGGPGPARPVFAPHFSDFVANGVNVGLRVRF
jgi:hypothetical protein